MKKTIVFLLLTGALVYSCKQKDSTSTEKPVSPAGVDSFLLTDSSWGLIRAADDFDKLKERYGAANLKDERICGPECMDSIDVTILYPGGENESRIYWEDSAYHRKISFIECITEKPRWYTADSIRIGSGLKELLRINGKKISFFGFGWDYGGTISSYNGGALDNSRIGYRLDLGESYGYNDMTIVGDVSIDSDMPAVQKAMDHIRVWRISLHFNKPAE